MYTGNKRSLEGIGGWLLLPLAALIVVPFSMAHGLYRNLWPIFSEGYWAAITTPGTAAYHRLWAGLIVLETAGSLFVFGLGLIALRYVVQKSRLAPRLVMAWLVCSLCLLAGDFYLGKLIPALAQQTDPASAAVVLLAAIGVGVGVPYFLRSKRVRRTFVR